MNIRVTPNLKPSKPGHYIKQWREMRRLTQVQLAERIGKTDGAISQLEAGITNYTQPTLEAIAYALSCSPDDLLGVNPLKEREVIDITEMLRKSSPELRQQAVNVVTALLRSSQGK